MQRVKRVFIWVHIVLWTIFTLLVCLQSSNDGPGWPNLAGSIMAICLYVFYCNFYLLTKYPGKQGRARYLPRLVAIFLTGPLPSLILYRQQVTTVNDTYDLYLMNLFLTTPVFLLLSWVARVTQNLVLNTIRKEQLEKQAVETELSFLKSQINPHFLFNTLNNIHTLVYKQAATAPEAVLRLSSLMRYMIYESNAHTVPLTREMTYLQDYIGLQQLRYKASPVVELKITGDTENCFVAPLLFIHFMENAYKHSPARLEQNDIRVTVDVKDNALTFRVQNPVVTKQSNSLEEPGGIGLPNIRKRLALLYPEQHTLQIDDTGPLYTVTLRIHDLHLQAHERKADVLYH